jgi:hypothetical protein
MTMTYHEHGNWQQPPFHFWLVVLLKKRGASSVQTAPGNRNKCEAHFDEVCD